MASSIDGCGEDPEAPFSAQLRTRQIVINVEMLSRSLQSADVLVSDAFNRPHITQIRRAFSLLCCVEVNIQSTPARIWALLTDAKHFHRWNSTVTAIEGEIRDGQRIRISVPGTDRTFTPQVSIVVPHVRMTWTGGFAPLFKGVRTFELRPQTGGSTTFVMQESFSGLMLPLVGRQLPDFGPVFERYATDLKHEAERTLA